MTVEDVIRDTVGKSDIAFGSSLYEEIAGGLSDIGLNLAFFVFTTREHSSYARILDGTPVSQPVLTVYLKYDADFRTTGIDPHLGNWDDQWAQTQTVRAVLNSILIRHALGNDYVSDDTLVIVCTREELAFREIGRVCKHPVQQFISNNAPGVMVSHVFWNGRQYDVILESKADYKRVKDSLRTKALQAIPGILASADIERYCQTYYATIEFGYSGSNLFNLMREDI